MGEVEYRRWYYKKAGGGYEFLLDRTLGLKKGYGLASENLVEKLVSACAEKSFRKAAASISSLTGQRISAMGAWGISQKYGAKIQAQEGRLEELTRCGQAGQLGNIASKVLFEEMDDVWLSMQNEKRQRSPVKGKRKKAGKKPVQVGTAYTGWEKTGENRYETVNKVAYAAFGAPSTFLAGFESLKAHCFDMDGVVRQILNADGASWIKAAAEAADVILQLDPFHRSRAVIRAVSDPNERKALLEVIRGKNVNDILESVKALRDAAKDEGERKKLEELYRQFSSNQDSLLTYQERGIELPPAPEEIVYRNLGTQKHSNSRLSPQLCWGERNER
jgi:hypothetical protein